MSKKPSLKQMRMDLVRTLENDLLEQAMVKQGWTHGDDGTMIPPGQTQPPIITEGKLQIEPEVEPKRKRWQLW